MSANYIVGKTSNTIKSNFLLIFRL